MTENKQIPEEKTISINGSLAERIKEELGYNVYLCYQCSKCTSGCPLAEFFDWQPHQIMRAIQLGQEDIALESKTPWLCASCQTCTTRCPQGLDITAIMEFLTRESLDRGIKPKVPETDNFNKAFMREVNIWGRSYEPGLMAEISLHSPKNAISDVELYLKMLQKGKVAFLPHPTRMPSKRHIKPDPKATTAVAYYPGCSLESTSTEYNLSTKEVCKELGFEIVEPKGWVCCGASAAHRSDPEEGLKLPIENLTLYEKSGYEEVTMPCAACYNRHKFAQYEVKHDETKAKKLSEAMGYEYQKSVYVSTLIESIYNHVGPENVTKHVKKPLTDLNLVCYYGCLLTRPPKVTQAENPENPTNMDTLMKALGAQVHDWSYKTTCCGAAHSLTKPDIVVELSGNIIRHAQEAGADAIAVACPLCHTNLDARQFQMSIDPPVPIFFFTQLMAVAFGLPLKSIGLEKNIIDPRPLLINKSLLERS